MNVIEDYTKKIEKLKQAERETQILVQQNQELVVQNANLQKEKEDL